MSLKRKRHEPKPIWAYREGEELSPELKLQEEQRLQSRPPPPVKQNHIQPQSQTQPQPQPTSSSAPSQNGSHVCSSGAVRPAVVNELVGYARPVSDDAKVYDGVSRKVCDFLWDMAVNDESVRNAIADPQVQLEVEARWGHIIDKRTDTRLQSFHDSECVIKSNSIDVKFESSMTMEQHRKMNQYLNSQVQRSKAPDGLREPVSYQHTREVDAFYELEQQGFDSLSPIVQRLIQESGTRQRIRVTRDEKSGQLLRALIKHRIANMEISSPTTEWDYRIGINLEINFTGPIESLRPVVENGRTAESVQRHKDRMSYSWLGAYQVDLTQVGQSQSKKHELELELDAGVLIDNADKVKRGEANAFEDLIDGMMNNLRVLSREITPPAPAKK